MTLETGARSLPAGWVTGRPRWMSPSTRSPSGTPTASRPSRVRKPRSPPVRGQAARVRAEQHGVDRGGCRADVLLVLLLRAAQIDGRDDERRRPVELRRLDRPGGVLEPASVSARGHGSARAGSGGGWARTWPGRAAPRPSRAARARPERLVRPAAPDGVVDVHGSHLARPGHRRAGPRRANRPTEKKGPLGRGPFEVRRALSRS